MNVENKINDNLISSSSQGSVIAIFDVGKTNKKLLLFDEQYHVVFEKSTNLIETVDEDGNACEDIHALTQWLVSSFNEMLANPAFDVKAINFSSYGASFVLIGEEGKVIAPLYNYLKPYPEYLSQKLYNTYGGKEKISLETASPVLGSLNSGMQLYRLKNEKPELFGKIKCALHLPQYLSYVITGKKISDITSIGCHTQLWNFEKKGYHHWVHKEKIVELLAPLSSSSTTAPINFNQHEMQAGIGLHDSSAALIPYLISFSEPFVLLSTGTWCISFNPFNNEPLTPTELQHDCVCYLTYQGKPVKASRLFAGREHEKQTKKLAAYFNVPDDYYKQIKYDAALAEKAKNNSIEIKIEPLSFPQRNWNEFATYEEAYHQFISDIIQLQYFSISLIINPSVSKLFVDGGFSKNILYMNMLAEKFPQLKTYAASVPQATATGAALVIHGSWNKQTLPLHLIALKKYPLLP